MNSRERVLSSANYTEPDKLPIDLGGHRSSGISAITYAKLKKALGINTGNIYVYDLIQQLAIIEQPVLDEFGVDVIELGRSFMLDDAEWKDWQLPDGTACKIPAYLKMVKEGNDWFLLSDSNLKLAVQKEGCLYFEQIYFPLENRNFENESFDDLEQMISLNMWSAAPTPGNNLNLDNEKDWLKLKDGAQELRTSTDKAIIGIFGGNLFELPQFLFRSDNYFLYMGMYPEKILELSEKITNIHLRNLEKYLSAVGNNIDIILFGDDLGTNLGPMIDPAMYREYYKPFHKKMWSKVKELAPDIKIQLHCCGGIEPFLDDLIEAGLDIINPVQINANGMNPVSLKNKYKDRITFWGGGCNTQEILNSKTPDEIEEHVKQMLEIWKPGGGYVFQQVHNIMADVPVENIVRMFETVNKYR